MRGAKCAADTESATWAAIRPDGYGERGGEYGGDEYGERRGVKGTGPYSRYRYR